MIQIDNVTRDNFDDSGLSNGYAIGTQMSDIETEILTLIRGTFAGVSDVKMRDLEPARVRAQLLAQTAGIQASAIALFQNARTELFDNLNQSIQNGYEVGKLSGARQTGESVVVKTLIEHPRGEETVRLANGSLLQAMGRAVIGAVRGATAAIALLTSDAFLGSDMTFRQAYDRYVVPTFETGLPGKTTVDGRDISLVSYAETVARESSQQALLIGESTAANAAGLYLVQISAHFACCPLCEPWQNAILVDDVWADGKPDGVHRLISEAIRSGLFHYNCRHVKRIYIPGKTVANNPPNYDPEKVAINYELEQTQRRLERDIRNYKRKLTMSLTEQERAKAEQKIAERQAQLRGLVKFADDNGYKVYRQNWKEQITFEKKPTRPYSVPTGGLSSENYPSSEYGTVVSETHYDDLDTAVQAAEKEIVQYNVEHAYVFTQDGRQIHVEGNKFTVNTEVVGSDALKGAVVTHNHPHELRAPSLQDLQSISHNGLAELRTVDKTNLYVLRFDRTISGEEIGTNYYLAKRAAWQRMADGDQGEENRLFLEEFIKLTKGVHYEVHGQTKA